MKKSKSIIMAKKRSTVEITDVDGWLFNLRYLTNCKESYSAQILATDVATRVKRLQSEGFLTINDTLKK